MILTTHLSKQYEQAKRRWVVAEGGKTGLMAVMTKFAFLISVFFSPIFASIPSWATGGALVVIDTLMI